MKLGLDLWSCRRAVSLKAMPVAFLIATISACATPNVSEPISQFAIASQLAGEAINVHNKAVTDYIQNKSRTFAVENSVGVRLAENSCLSNSPHCEIVLYRSKADQQAKKSESLTNEFALQKIPKLMGLISAYAENLAALASADSTESVRGSLDATAGSIANIVEAISPGKAARVSEIATPVSRGLSWTTNRYLDNLKRNGLRRATKAADPLVGEAALLLQDVESELVNVAKARLAEDVSVKFDAFRADPTRANLDLLITTADAYDGFLTASTESLFNSMAKAHSGLKQALSSESLSLGGAFGEVQFFLAQAVEIKEVGEQLAAALKSGEKE